MAGKADRGARASRAQGVFCPRLVVANRAFPFGKGLVGALPDQMAAIRSVGVVAGCATGALRGIIKVRFFRLLVLGGMARGAYLFQAFFQQALVIRGVGAMTSQTVAFFHRIVLVFP